MFFIPYVTPKNAQEELFSSLKTTFSCMWLYHYPRDSAWCMGRHSSGQTPQYFDWNWLMWNWLMLTVLTIACLCVFSGWEVWDGATPLPWAGHVQWLHPAPTCPHGNPTRPHRPQDRSGRELVCECEWVTWGASYCLWVRESNVSVTVSVSEYVTLWVSDIVYLTISFVSYFLRLASDCRKNNINMHAFYFQFAVSIVSVCLFVIPSFMSLFVITVINIIIIYISCCIQQPLWMCCFNMKFYLFIYFYLYCLVLIYYCYFGFRLYFLFILIHPHYPYSFAIISLVHSLNGVLDEQCFCGQASPVTRCMQPTLHTASSHTRSMAQTFHRYPGKYPQLLPVPCLGYYTQDRDLKMHLARCAVRPDITNPHGWLGVKNETSIYLHRWAIVVPSKQAAVVTYDADGCVQLSDVFSCLMCSMIRCVNFVWMCSAVQCVAYNITINYKSQWKTDLWFLLFC